MAEQESVSFEELVEWAEGRVPAARADVITRRVAEDAILAAQAEWIAQFLETARPLTLVSPPPAVQTALRATWREQRGATASEAASQLGAGRVWGWLERLLGNLSLDSAGQPLAAGVRGSGGDYRQLAYTTPRADVALSIVPARGNRSGQTAPDGVRVAVHGQIFPTQTEAATDEDSAQDALLDVPPYLIQFVQDGREAVVVESDPLGEFEVAAVAAGAYEIVLTGPDYEVILADVPLVLDEDRG